MKQTPPPQPVAPSVTQEPNLPVESLNLTPQDILEPSATTTQPPQEIAEWGDDRYYVHHWGINE